MQPANPNLLPVSATQGDLEAAAKHVHLLASGTHLGLLADLLAAHRLAAEQSKDAAFVAMLEGMKDKPILGRCSGAGLTVTRNAVIDEAIAKAKALGEGRMG